MLRRSEKSLTLSGIELLTFPTHDLPVNHISNFVILEQIYKLL